MSKKLLGLLWSAGYAPAVLDPWLYDGREARMLPNGSLLGGKLPTREDYEKARATLTRLLETPRPLKQEVVRHAGKRSRRSGVLSFAKGETLNVPYDTPGLLCRDEVYYCAHRWVIPAGTVCRHADISKENWFGEPEVLVVFDAKVRASSVKVQQPLAADYGFRLGCTERSERRLRQMSVILDDLATLAPGAPVLVDTYTTRQLALDARDWDKLAKGAGMVRVNGEVIGRTQGLRKVLRGLKPCK